MTDTPLTLMPIHSSFAALRRETSNGMPSRYERRRAARGSVRYPNLSSPLQWQDNDVGTSAMHQAAADCLSIDSLNKVRSPSVLLAGRGCSNRPTLRDPTYRPGTASARRRGSTGEAIEDPVEA